MNSRQRVLTALRHQTPDRVPLDFGGTNTSGIHASVVAALREHYGLEKRPVLVHEPMQMLGWIDDDLKQSMGIDTEGLFPRKAKFGMLNADWKPFRMPDGLEVLIAGGLETTVAPNGDILAYPQGDTSVPPSARMPAGGHFFDAIVRQDPIDEARLDPDDNLQEYGPVSNEDVAYFAKEANRAAATGRAVLAAFGGTSLGDVGNITGFALKHPKGIRDFSEWYMSIATRPDYIHAVFSKQIEIALANLQKIAAAVPGTVDVAFVCGTDFGTQSSTFCSLRTFRDLYKPYYKQVNDWIHKNTGWKTFKHSCGAVEKFIEDFIDCGFDILNPVQCSAANMEPQTLKQKYGDRLVFWGGGVDTQKTLPFGAPEDVRREVLSRCEIFAERGGFVFNTVHNIQAKTPVRNIVAMVEAVREFNGGK